MASPRVSRLRPLLVLAFFLAVWWLAPVGVRSFTRASFSLFEAPGQIAYSRVKDLQDYWSLRDQDQASLIVAGRDIQRHANDDDLQLQQAVALRDENERLSAALLLPAEPGFRYEVARVIRREETAWWQQIVIRKGAHDGIVEGQGVIFAGGVVGRIKEAGPLTSVVELVTSPSFRMAANLGADSKPVIFQGVETAPFHNPNGEVLGIMDSPTLSPDQPLRLVSSNLSGRFPAGLALGVVDHFEPGSDGLSKTGIVKLDARLLNLQEVTVLIPDNTTLPLPTPAAAKPASGK